MSMPQSGLSLGIVFGVLYITAGALGIASSRGPRTSLLVACMVLSIIAALLTIGQLTYGAVTHKREKDHYHGYLSQLRYYSLSSYRSYNSHYSYYPRTTTPITRGVYKSRLAVLLLHVLVALVEAAAAIWQAALTCHACCTCCCRPRDQQVGQQVIYLNQAGSGATLMVLTPSGQLVPMVPQGQAMVPQGGPAMVVPVGGGDHPPTSTLLAPPAYTAPSTSPPPYNLGGSTTDAGASNSGNPGPGTLGEETPDTKL